MIENTEKQRFETGDRVRLSGTNTPLVIVTLSGDVAHCSPLPYSLGETVTVVSVAQLEAWTGVIKRSSA